MSQGSPGLDRQSISRQVGRTELHSPTNLLLPLAKAAARQAIN